MAKNKAEESSAKPTESKRFCQYCKNHKNHPSTCKLTGSHVGRKCPGCESWKEA